MTSEGEASERRNAYPTSGDPIADPPWDYCLDCEAPLIPCTCRSDCPGGMCSDRRCNPGAPEATRTTHTEPAR